MPNSEYSPVIKAHILSMFKSGQWPDRISFRKLMRLNVYIGCTRGSLNAAIRSLRAEGVLWFEKNLLTRASLNAAVLSLRPKASLTYKNQPGGSWDYVVYISGEENASDPGR